MKRLYTEKGANSLGPLQHEEVQKTCDSLNVASQGLSQAAMTDQLQMSVDSSSSYKRSKQSAFVDISFKYKPVVESMICYMNADLSDVSDQEEEEQQMMQDVSE